jgi:hydrogenase/urease accessory protein HupE
MRSALAALLGALALAVIGVASPTAAHELRPAYLELTETSPDRYAVLWRVPASGDRRLALYLHLPPSCTVLTEPAGRIADGSYFERWQAECPGGLKGETIAVDGLRSSLTDALARVAWSDGTMEVARLTPEQPTHTLRGSQTVLEVARAYLLLGVEHILGGIDHLLFVLALMLLIREPWMLVKTITAFTLAHSITLAGAALGWFSLPQAPVEAVIALSIAFVASELLRQRPGERRLSQAYPWVIAFVFGLLHGFGFAGALKEIGLPQGDVPLALLAFNFGVEAGQLLFVAAVVALWRSLTALTRAPPEPVRFVLAYAIGTAATVWLIERLMAFA